LRFRISFAPILLLALLHVPPAAAQFPPAPGTGPGLPETIEAIDSARVTTRILYITAHPDDESAAVLTYLARGLHADVALLSITRGEGGQNALGPEQAPQLGLIRTQELLAATRGYGVKLYFTRARDFGYSKTPEETEKIWGDQVLEDMVRVIREFRPNIVINHWGGVHGGHGHHQVSGLWTPKAVALAADPKAFPGEDFHLPPWSNGSAGVQILSLDRFTDKPSAYAYTLPLDDISPLYGKSWRELGLDAFVNHRTQGIAGFLNSPFLRRPISLQKEGEGTIDPDSLNVSLPLLFGPKTGTYCRAHSGRCEALANADEELNLARKAALALDFVSAANHSSQAAKSIASLLPADRSSAIRSVDEERADFELRILLGRIARAQLAAADFSFHASAESSELVAGEPFSFTVYYSCRPMVQCPIEGPVQVWADGRFYSATSGTPQSGLKFSVTVSKMPMDSLEVPPAIQGLTPESSSLISVTLKQPIDSTHSLSTNAPVLFPFASSTHITRIPVRLVPAYALAVEPVQVIEALGIEHKPFDVFLRVQSYSTKAAKVTVGLNVPDGLQTTSPVDLTFDGIADQYAKFTVTPPANLAPGNFTITAYAKRGDETFSTSLEPLPSMPSILWSEPAQCIVHAFDINVPPNLHVGYISAEGEPIPDALKRLAINVDLLDATALNFGDLSKYDAIVVGVRAYELRPELPGANKRLLDYVSNGGTLVVQYNRDSVWDKLQPAPYPAKIGSPTPRTTDETAEVKFLQPNDPLLNAPNKITAADFNNWVQERGLYYWSTFDSRYTPLLAMHDPGESDLNGSLVYTRYGQGTYIYTGLSFFRQLPEGNSGAYRLFVNLVSASRTQKHAATQ
jgi:LmbE family N-acetylglucosaminyl deacetylase